MSTSALKREHFESHAFSGTFSLPSQLLVAKVEQVREVPCRRLTQALGVLRTVTMIPI
jgi:hypothetical protein